MLFDKAAIFIGLTCLFISCTKQEIDPATENYVFSVPAHFPQPVFDTENPLTKEGIALGRMLFYDVRLSGNNAISCASCHAQSLAFSDGKALTSVGVSGKPLLRHSPALINMAWVTNGLFWDGGSTNLESQAFAPLTAPDEMGQDLVELIAELKAVPDYVARFKLVFKDEIKSHYVVKALAQFQRTLISASSRYDNYKAQGHSLTPQELEGMAIVAQKCQGCHTGELFTDNVYHNNGIDTDFSNTEHEGLYLGRYRISYNAADLGSFKTPTLRNIGLTAPYMHDGRFRTLEEVVDHYSEGIRDSESLDPLLPVNGFQLSDPEKKAVIAFLNTLTDQKFTTNKELGAPF